MQMPLTFLPPTMMASSVLPVERLTELPSNMLQEELIRLESPMSLDAVDLALLSRWSITTKGEPIVNCSRPRKRPRPEPDEGGRRPPPGPRPGPPPGPPPEPPPRPPPRPRPRPPPQPRYLDRCADHLRISSRPRAATGRPEKCNCRKSRCLKLYCVCFANSRTCVDCNCRDCCNYPESLHLRTAIEKLGTNGVFFRKMALQRLGAREPPADVTASTTRTPPKTRPPQWRTNVQGCTCKKSRCIKKYCECFANGLQCCEDCSCADCCNRPQATGTPSTTIESTQNAQLELQT